MSIPGTKTPKATTFERAYPGSVAQVRRVRADLTPVANSLPFADDLVLLASELSTNAVVHSRSREPGGEFTVRVCVHPGDYAWVEIEDQGGPWIGGECDDRPHGLDIVAAIAGPDNWGIDGGPACRVAWFRLDWMERS